MSELPAAHAAVTQAQRANIESYFSCVTPVADMNETPKSSVDILQDVIYDAAIVNAKQWYHTLSESKVREYFDSDLLNGGITEPRLFQVFDKVSKAEKFETVLFKDITETLYCPFFQKFSPYLTTVSTWTILDSGNAIQATGGSVTYNISANVDFISDMVFYVEMDAPSVRYLDANVSEADKPYIRLVKDAALRLVEKIDIGIQGIANKIYTMTNRSRALHHQFFEDVSTDRVWDDCMGNQQHEYATYACDEFGDSDLDSIGRKTIITTGNQTPKDVKHWAKKKFYFAVPFAAWFNKDKYSIPAGLLGNNNKLEITITYAPIRKLFSLIPRGKYAEPFKAAIRDGTLPPLVSDQTVGGSIDHTSMNITSKIHYKFASIPNVLTRTLAYSPGFTSIRMCKDVDHTMTTAQGAPTTGQVILTTKIPISHITMGAVRTDYSSEDPSLAADCWNDFQYCVAKVNKDYGKVDKLVKSDYKIILSDNSAYLMSPSGAAGTYQGDTIPAGSELVIHSKVNKSFSTAAGAEPLNVPLDVRIRLRNPITYSTTSPIQLAVLTAGSIVTTSATQLSDLSTQEVMHALWSGSSPLAPTAFEFSVVKTSERTSVYYKKTDILDSVEFRYSNHILLSFASLVASNARFINSTAICAPRIPGVTAFVFCSEKDSIHRPTGHIVVPSSANCEVNYKTAPGAKDCTMYLTLYCNNVLSFDTGTYQIEYML